jgi:hypothetical protein
MPFCQCCWLWTRFPSRMWIASCTSPLAISPNHVSCRMGVSFGTWVRSRIPWPPNPFLPMAKRLYVLRSRNGSRYGLQRCSHSFGSFSVDLSRRNPRDPHP